MFGSSDPRWDEDPRDRYDADPRHRDEDDHRSTIDGTDPREQGDRYEREIERDHGWDVRDREPDDPRDVLLNELEVAYAAAKLLRAAGSDERRAHERAWAEWTCPPRSSHSLSR